MTFLQTNFGEWKYVFIYDKCNCVQLGRYWFENENNGMGCTKEEIEEIRATTLKDILIRNEVYKTVLSLCQVVYVSLYSSPTANKPTDEFLQGNLNLDL